MKLAHVNLRPDGEYVVLTYSEANAWVLDGPISRLPPETDAETLGIAVLKALDLSRGGLPDLTRDSKPSKPLLELFEVSSYNAYMKRMKSVSVALEEIGGIFKVTPDVNAGTNEGFTPLIEHRVETHFDTPEELGQAILEAFTKAR